MERVFVSIGSNLGDRAGNCKKAIEALGSTKWACISRVSSLYEAEPWGKTDQGPFVNCVAEIQTSLAPEGLLSYLLEIEISMGRVRESEAERWGPRLIDLDILLYGDRVVRKEGLKIPHPLISERAFVLVPLAEIAPEVVHPELEKTAKELLREVPGRDGVRKFEA